jgi:hypothetical protein
MPKANGTHRRPLHLDNPVEVPGGVIGSEPYRRWGPAVRWAIIVLETPLMGNVNWRPLNKRDVVIVDSTRTEEFYREGPFSSVAASNRQSEIVLAIQSEGLDPFLHRMQIEELRIGPVSVETQSTSPTEYVVSAVRRWFG